MAVRIATKTLGSGHTIPVLGLGVYQSEPGAETYNAVLSALKLGYRHIDTAQFYRNERDVGRAIRDSGVPRDQIFVTSKHFARKWSYADALRIVQESVAHIGGGYIDLYLLHAPGRPEGRADAWRALEDAQKQGLVRDIGVSNYGEAHLEALSETWRVKPAVNQIELHPWLTRTTLVAYCTAQGIHLQAYSPLVRAQKMDDATLRAIAAQTQATPAQVLVAWSLAKGFITLPKSVKPHRQRENLEAATLSLSAQQVAALDALDAYFVTGWDPIKDHAVRSSL